MNLRIFSLSLARFSSGTFVYISMGFFKKRRVNQSFRDSACFVHSFWIVGRSAKEGCDRSIGVFVNIRACAHPLLLLLVVVYFQFVVRVVVGRKSTRTRDF